MDPLRELNCLIGQLFLACTTTIVLIVQIYFALLYNSTYRPYLKRKLFEWIGFYKQQRKHRHIQEQLNILKEFGPTNQPMQPTNHLITFVNVPAGYDIFIYRPRKEHSKSTVFSTEFKLGFSHLINLPDE